MGQKAKVFVFGPFKPSLMLEGKARNLPEGCFKLPIAD